MGNEGASAFFPHPASPQQGVGDFLATCLENIQVIGIRAEIATRVKTNRRERGPRGAQVGGMPSVSLARSPPVALAQPHCAAAYGRSVVDALQPRLPLSNAASAPALHCDSAGHPRNEVPLKWCRTEGEEAARPATAPADAQPTGGSASPSSVAVHHLAASSATSGDAGSTSASDDEVAAATSAAEQQLRIARRQPAVALVLDASAHATALREAAGGGGVSHRQLTSSHLVHGSSIACSGAGPPTTAVASAAGAAAATAAAPPRAAGAAPAGFRSSHEILFGKPPAPFTGYPVRRRERNWRLCVDRTPCGSQLRRSLPSGAPGRGCQLSHLPPHARHHRAPLITSSSFAPRSAWTLLYFIAMAGDTCLRRYERKVPETINLETQREKTRECANEYEEKIIRIVTLQKGGERSVLVPIWHVARERRGLSTAGRSPAPERTDRIRTLTPPTVCRHTRRRVPKLCNSPRGSR